MLREIDKIADKLEYEISANFPLYDSYDCGNCGNGVYIMNEFERFPDLVRELGVLEFSKWFKEYEIEIDSCCTCHYTLWFHDEYPEEEALVKSWILNILEEN